jgi:hypothetical protein
MRNLTIICRGHDLDIQAANMLVEAMWQEFRMQLVEVTSVTRVQLARVDGPMSWTVSHCQFKAMVGHNNWTAWEKATHRGRLLTCQLGMRE